MRDILARPQARVLEAFARGNTVLVFDYDGTLAPIVADPARARPRPGTRRILAQATRLYPSAMIAGRTIDDLFPFVNRLGFLILIGNYGGKPDGFGFGPGPRGRAGAWRADLAERLGALDGVRFEDKGFTLSIHYRKAGDRAAARRQILAATTSLPGLRIVDGNCVVEVLPAPGPDKGTALLGIREALACDDAIYVGDDAADEDIFALQDAGVLGIRVGRSRSSHARYFLEDQQAVDRLLKALVELRSGRLKSS